MTPFVAFADFSGVHTATVPISSFQCDGIEPGVGKIGMQLTLMKLRALL